MFIKRNVKLAEFTTFKIGGSAKVFCVVKNQFDALEAYELAKEEALSTFVLGGGSNLLVSDKGFDGLVMKVENKGIEVIDSSEKVYLKVASGEVWDEVVKFAVQNGWWGIENLSHIPGSTGAIAVQNVGAYGQEARNVIESVTAFDRTNGQIVNIDAQSCGFTYRASIFNTTQKGRYIIFYITFILQKNGLPIISYRDLKTRFEGKQPTLAELRRAVTEIRDTKFPYPTEAKKGNAGSFFKNPILTHEQYERLESLIAANFGATILENLKKKIFIDGESYKVPAAFLLDICGLKDVQFEGAKINRNQPLVIVNASGQATARDVLNLARHVLITIKARAGIELKIEPELLGFSEKELHDIIRL